MPELHDLWPGSARGALPTFSSDGRFLAELLWRPDAKRAGSGTACVVVTKTVNGGVLSRVEIPINAGHGRLFFSADSRSFFLGHDGKVSQFEAHSGRLLRLLNPATTEGQLLPLAVSPDGRFILVLATEAGQAHRGDLQVIELLTGTVRKRWSWAQTRASSAMPLFSPDGQTIAMPRDDGTVVLLPVGVDAPSSDRANLWRDLASGDAAIAGAAIESLVAHPDAAGWIRERLADTSPKPDLPVLFWLAELEHEDYDRREAARRTLARQPDRLEELEAALVGPASADLAHTLARLREDRTAPPTADVRRRERLQEALDRLANSSRPPTP